MRKKKFDPLLAEGWPMSKVQLCLADRSQKNMLVSFVRKRFEERFFGPIRVLRRAADNSQGYGFAMMSLCSLLVESIESFRLGLPSTYRPDMRNLHTYSPPRECEVPQTEWRTGHQVFEEFFKEPKQKWLFPGIDGAKFCEGIRNGLLHQAQTKNGWTLRIDRKRLCAPKAHVINRNLFARRLEKAFHVYLRELQKADWDDELWRKARRKIWWLIELSQPKA